MDPAVTASLISAPVTVVAAVAAFAAGRAQARGAHRGPVDAVRRQHQRDAYAAFHAAAQAFVDASEWYYNSGRATERLESTGQHFTIVDWLILSLDLVHEAPLTPVLQTKSVVELEGPDEVAEAAATVVEAAAGVLSAARHGGFYGPSLDPDPMAIRDAAEDRRDGCRTAHAELNTKISSFLRIRPRGTSVQRLALRTIMVG
ncbi:hypothetical protein ACFW5W_36350 [Streptomyces sp. NPDC058783]|uniref:hypothetical protein n=1 Tax=Streptomyces sp. NPDC058783 TaxID=3346633 RepID=UPI0036B8EA1C